MQSPPNPPQWPWQEPMLPQYSLYPLQQGYSHDPPPMPLESNATTMVTDEQTSEETTAPPEEETLYGILLVRLIDLKTLSWPLRTVVYVVLMQLLAAAVVLGLRDIPQPHVVITLEGYSPVQVPVSIVIVSYSAVVVTWCVVLTGALQGRWFLRFPLLLIFSAATISMQGSMPTILLNSVLVDFAVLAGFALLLGLWLWAILVPMIRRLALREGIPEHTRENLIFLGTAGVVVIVMLTNYVVPLLMVVTSGVLQQASTGLFVAIGFLFLLLVPVLLINGTDFAEWGDALAIAGTSVVRRSRSPRLTAAITAIVACGIAIYAFVEMHLVHPHRDMGVLIAVLLLLAPFCAVVAVGGLALMFKVGGMPHWRPTRIPILGILVALVAFTAAGFLLPPTLLLMPVVGFLLLLRGRGRGGRLAAAGVFLLLELPVGLASASSYLLHVSGVQLMVALMTLWVLLWLVLRRKPMNEYREFITLLLWLNLALAAVAAILGVLRDTGALGEQISVAAAALLVLAQIWDLLMSGEQVTNVHGRLVSRPVRVLLYMGYVTLVTTLILAFSYFSKYATTPVFGSFFDTDSWAAFGLVLLGVPWLGAIFSMRLSEWIGRRRRIASTQLAKGPANVGIPSSYGGDTRDMS